MQEYQPSKLLKTILKQSGSEQEAIPKKFKINPHYVPPEIPVELQKEQSSQEQCLDELIIQAERKKSEQKFITNEKQKIIKISEKEQEERDDLQQIPIHAPMKEFEHMKPEIIGETEENNKCQEISFLQALRQGLCILQLPNKLPFHEVGKPIKQQTNQSNDSTSQLQEYYNEKYDSCGFPLGKNYQQLNNQINGNGISLGKILIDTNGKTTWKAGREEFSIVQGIQQSSYQKCLVIEEGKCDFQNIGQKFIAQANY